VTPLAWTGEGRLRTAVAASAHWFSHLQLWRPGDGEEIETGDAETAALLLSGTFDLSAGPTAWPARGARTTPFEGRPMAVFLPGHTTFRAARGRGEILLVTARRPATPAVSGRPALSQKPLLPLAGSGKAFDPATGDWLPAEAFPDSPESLPPRRMTRFPAGSVVVERVLAPDYKAATLCLDEVVVPAGKSLRVADVAGRPRCDETCVFLRSEAAVRVTVGNRASEVRGDAVFLVPGAGDDVAVAAAATAPAYVVLAYAGKPRSGS
jgi:hypothetical protein